ncbi:MAG: DEAD/DEAH box helicase [Acidobacteriota bacterium]|nr:DEAD/DEAH box helicase [Acidobacteriota bacterium]
MEELVREFLGRLEAEEEKLLTWGVVDGGFSRDEVEELAQAFLEETGSVESSASLIKELRDRRLLFDLNLGSRRVYRTRMAESVRLFARLRQLFPNRRWQIAPTLVADFRFSLRPRRYPQRHIEPEQVVSELRHEKLVDALKEAVLMALLDSPERGRVKLANFQARATKTMLRDLAGTRDRGIIVGASTGTGKTLAFYLPALTHIASLMSADSFWTKALAIYPRNELLKDQFLETYSEARRLDKVLGRYKGRKLSIGAFFGSTPRRVSLDEIKDKWESQSGGYVCPYLPCPRCEGPLLWLESDIDKKIERLQCTKRDCRAVVSHDEVMLTRERMAHTPPDIVFTTTEMLNRQMADATYGLVFGVGARRSPQLVLLDEVHTYSSVHGAQVAYLLRRWRRAVGGRVQFTGLSATLRNASDFFGLLVGLNPASVEEISQGETTEVMGMEYQLALRGDPVSGASLLSTSIQSAMLLSRILDPAAQSPSFGSYGSRVFLFTDDLDVTNRLYHNLQDAEGLNSWGQPDPRRSPLAALRASAGLDAAMRLNAGQSWHMCEKIGHQLARPMRVGRTSSQDVGVEQGADIIVATASLEVGFNDPDVGAVMQHKAPLDMASFLQRKGRAGRRRTMRPWTVVVLSDYGRDRVAYQGYDLLFDPLLDERTLSVGNRYVLRMQAAFALMDWFGERLRQERLPAGSVWNDFAGAPRGTGLWSANMRTRQGREAELVRGILERDDLRAELEEYVQSALRISKAEAHAVMWGPPRALMTAVLPTLLRRLESGWKRLTINDEEPDQDYQVPNSPLPDFVPQSLFSDLNLPEVIVTTPPQRRGAEPLQSPMPIVQALKEFAPGRVSRRFGIYHAFASHWIAPPDLQAAEQALPVEQFCAEFDEAGSFQIKVQDEIIDVRCVRPRELKPQLPAANVEITSNSFLDWRSQFVPSDVGDELELPHTSAWGGFLREIRAFTHTRRTHVEVRRFAVGARASIRFKGGASSETYIRFTEARSGRPASVGFGKAVDGLVFRYELPANFGVRADDPNRAKGRACRTAYFKHRVQTDERLDGIANSFQRDWLYQIYLSTLTARALVEQQSLEDANDSLQQSGRVGEEMANVLEVIFQTLEVDESEEGEEGAQGEEATTTYRQPTHERLLALCRTPAVTEALGDIARVLWEEPDDGWHAWSALRFKATLGAALLQACFHLCPQFESGDLLLDVDPGPRPRDAQPVRSGLEEIWITESTLGGGGVIEEIIRRYNSDPRHFFRLAEGALQASDFEIVDVELTRLLELQASDGDIAEALHQVREAQRHEEAVRANEYLRRLLVSRAILVTHPVVAALNARVLKPGSSAQTDNLLRDLIHTWRAEEERLNVEIDARVFAYVASARDDLDRALGFIGQVAVPDRTWRFQAIYGLLWPRGNTIRARALAAYNRFAHIPDVEREILLDVLRPAERRVSLDDPDWRGEVTEVLKHVGAVSLVASSANHDELKSALLDLVAEPLDINFLHLYPQVEGFRREPDALVAMLRMRETIQ